MQEIDPLTIPLRDIHLPEQISWWPLAPGWWILLAIPVIGLLGYLVFRYLRRDKMKRRLSNRLDVIEQNFLTHNDPHRLARELSMFTRQLALLTGTREITFAATTGSAWVDYWADEFSSSGLSAEELKRALTIAPYRRAEGIDGQKIINAVREAINTWEDANKTRAISSPTTGLGKA